MPGIQQCLTRPFNDTVRERFLRDESFREVLIAEAFKEIESGDKAVGLAILNDCILPAYREAGREASTNKSTEHRLDW